MSACGWRESAGLTRCAVHPSAVGRTGGVYHRPV